MSGCEAGGKETKATKIPATSLVRLTDLPVSSRHDGSVTNAAIKIEITPKQLYLMEQPADVRNLKTLLSGHVEAELRMHALVSYAKLIEILKELHTNGVRRVSFRVRKKTNPAEEGLLELGSFQVVDASVEKVEWEGLPLRTWDSFLTQWEAPFEICLSASRDCSPPPDAPEKGGNLQIVLSLFQSAVRLHFYQVDPPPKYRYEHIQVMDFGGNEKSNKPSHITKAIELKAPRTREYADVPRAIFTFPITSTEGASSTVAKALHSFCDTEQCAFRFSATRVTRAGVILALIANAIPHGLPAPSIAFETP